MKNDMIEIRDKFLFTHWKNTNCVLKAFIISFQFLLTHTENCIVPMTEKLYDVWVQSPVDAEPFDPKQFADGLFAEE